MSKAFDFDDDDDFDCQPKGGLGMKATLSRKSSNSSSLSATSSLSSKDGIHRKLSSKTYGKVCPKVASLNPTSHAESQEEDVVVVTLDGVEKGESQAKSDELEYLLEGVHSGGSVTRNASIVKLVDACSSPHARFMLRLSGCLPKLLDAVVVAKDVKNDDYATRMNLALIAFTLLQDRANLEYASFPCICGLASLLTPLLLGNNQPMKQGSKTEVKKGKVTIEEEGGAGVKRETSGWRNKHKFQTASHNSQSSSKKVDEVALSRKKSTHLLRGKVAPYSSDDIDAAHLSLLTLVHLITTCSNINNNSNGGGTHKTTHASNGKNEEELKSPNVSTGFRQYRSKSQSPMMMKRQLGGNNGGSVGGWQDPNYILGENLRESGALVSLANVVCDEVSDAISQMENQSSSSSKHKVKDNFWDWKLLHSLQLLEFSASQSEQNQFCLSQDHSTTAAPSPTRPTRKRISQASDTDQTDNGYNRSPNTFSMKTNQNCCNIIPSLVELIRISYVKLKEVSTSSSSSSCSLTQSPPCSLYPSHREILACSLKVLINLTHHHPTGVNSFVNYGMLPLVNCVLFTNKHVHQEWKDKNENSHLPTSPSLHRSESKGESVSLNDEDDNELFHSEVDSQLVVKQSEESFDITPQKHGGASINEDNADMSIGCDVPYFDLLLLSLTVLTNCAEISSVSRLLLSEIRIQHSIKGDSYEIALNASNEESHTTTPLTLLDDNSDHVRTEQCDFCSFLCLLLRHTLSNFKSELEEELNTVTTIDVDQKADEKLETATNEKDEDESRINDDESISNKLNKKKGAVDISDENGWEVEELVVSSYFSLLLGCLIRENDQTRKLVNLKLSLEYDPEEVTNDADLDPLFQEEGALPSAGGCGGLNVLVRVLTAFVALQSSAGVLTEMSLAPVLALIDEISGHDNLKSVSSSSSSAAAVSMTEGVRGTQSLPLKLNIPSIADRSTSVSSSTSSCIANSEVSKQPKKTKKTYGSTKSKEDDVSSQEQTWNDRSFDLFTDDMDTQRKETTTERKSVSNDSLGGRSKTWPSPEKESGGGGRRLKEEVKVEKSSKRIKMFNRKDKATTDAFTFEAEDDIFKESFGEENEKHTRTKSTTTQKRIKLVKSSAVSTHPTPSSSSLLSEATAVSTTASTSSKKSNLSRTASVNEGDEGTASLNKRSVTTINEEAEEEEEEEGRRGEPPSAKCGYQVGDHVKVEERTQPGFNKPGGIARVTKVQESSFDGSLVYDVKYVLGRGSEKSLSSHLLQPYDDSVGGSQVSRSSSISSSTSSTRRSVRSKPRGGGVRVEDEEEDDIFGCSQELTLLGMSKATSSFVMSSAVDRTIELKNRQTSDSSSIQSEVSSTGGSQPTVKMSKKRKK